ncbi:MAG TPA: transposase [Vicinamibacterales bacterium]|nr:transposase [Vicinamibacterales bacterium]
MSRGTGRMKIFLDDGDRHMFMLLLADVVTEYALDCYDFCLMNNHFHLSIRNRRRNLSEAMQKLKGEYASSWNAKRGRVGHTFEGPFRDQIVQDQRYFRTLARYIARNPVRAHLVLRPVDWRWSSYRYHAGVEAAPEFLASARLLESFAAGDPEAARRAYIAHVNSMSDGEKDTELFRARRRIVGDAAFRNAIRAKEKALRAAARPAMFGTDAAFANLPV